MRLSGSYQVLKIGQPTKQTGPQVPAGEKPAPREAGFPACQPAPTIFMLYDASPGHDDYFDNVRFRILREGGVRSAGETALRSTPCVTTN
ncbi:MAG: hypothetical protein Kow0063_31670 [Anaerolineae bacterium]